jgi:hypothetical protein
MTNTPTEFMNAEANIYKTVSTPITSSNTAKVWCFAPTSQSPTDCGSPTTGGVAITVTPSGTDGPTCDCASDVETKQGNCIGNVSRDPSNTIVPPSITPSTPICNLQQGTYDNVKSCLDKPNHVWRFLTLSDSHGRLLTNSQIGGNPAGICCDTSSDNRDDSTNLCTKLSTWTQVNGTCFKPTNCGKYGNMTCTTKGAMSSQGVCETTNACSPPDVGDINCQWTTTSKQNIYPNPYQPNCIGTATTPSGDPICIHHTPTALNSLYTPSYTPPQPGPPQPDPPQPGPGGGSDPSGTTSVSVKLGAGAIIGIIIGVGFVLFVIITYYKYLKRKRVQFDFETLF